MPHECGKTERRGGRRAEVISGAGTGLEQGSLVLGSCYRARACWCASRSEGPAKVLALAMPHSDSSLLWASAKRPISQCAAPAHPLCHGEVIPPCHVIQGAAALPVPPLSIARPSAPHLSEYRHHLEGRREGAGFV